MLFKISDQNKFKKDFTLENINSDIYCCIWTTTPWTLPANQAVAIGNEVDYVLIKIDNKYIIVAEDLLDRVAGKIEAKDNAKNILKKIKGQSLLNYKTEHPFYDKLVPIIHANHVTTENGTGSVSYTHLTLPTILLV